MPVFAKCTVLEVEVGCTHKSSIKIVSTSSLSCECSLLKVRSFLFGSTVSASTVSKPIFDINVTEDNTKNYTPMLSVRGKNVLTFGSLAASASPKSGAGGFSE